MIHKNQIHAWSIIIAIACVAPPAFTQDPKKIHYSVLPDGSQITGPNQLMITTTTASFYFRRKTSFLSTVSVAPYVPIPDHWGLAVHSNLNAEKWRIEGDIRCLYYPQNTWGLYGNPETTGKLLIDYKYLRVYQTWLHRINSRLYAGLGYLLDVHMDMDPRGDSLLFHEFTRYKSASRTNEHSLSSGLTINISYDDRLQSGNYGDIVYRINPIFLGSNANWHSLYADFRKYVPLGADKEQRLCFWTYYWTVFNSPAPFLDLPSIGWDPYQQRSARGFPQNRFRSKNLLYAETEYRSPFYVNGHVGFVLFFNINSVTEPVTSRFMYGHTATGGGVRLKFSKLSTAKLAIDCAVSDGYFGIYFNIGDTF